MRESLALARFDVSLFHEHDEKTNATLLSMAYCTIGGSSGVKG